MDKMYIKLSVEKRENDDRDIVETIEDYQQLFQKRRQTTREHSMNLFMKLWAWLVCLCRTIIGWEIVANDQTAGMGGMPTRVLLHGDPGIGKTTLAKKIAWDWTTNQFCKFSLVFYFSMSLVATGDSIEKAILKQTPSLQACGVSGDILRKLLKSRRFGHRCLIILDGLDEFQEGKYERNEDFRQLIEESFSRCSVVLTTNPHYSATIEHHFRVVAKILGCTNDESSTQFIKLRLPKEHQAKTQQVAEFVTENLKSPKSPKQTDTQEESDFVSPMLLVFVCYLVQNDPTFDLSKRGVLLGEIYARLVHCLYRKFLTRSKVEETAHPFVEVLRSIGYWAHSTLQQGNNFAKKKEVLADIGQYAFEYGLLVGSEDIPFGHRIGDDLFLSFLHETIKEFLVAAFYCFDDDVVIDTSVLLDNPLILEFSVWISGSSTALHSELGFSTGRCEDARKKLVHIVAGVVNLTTLDLIALEEYYPALDFSQLQLQKPSASQQQWTSFFREVFESCGRVKEMVMSTDHSFDSVLEAFVSKRDPLLLQIGLVLVLDQSFTRDSISMFEASFLPFGFPGVSLVFPCKASTDKFWTARGVRTRNATSS